MNNLFNRNSARSIKELVSSQVLHTAPHHDDIYLGYFPILNDWLKIGSHEIVYFTSGENGVCDEFINKQNMSLLQIKEAKRRCRESEAQNFWENEGCFSPIHHLRSSLYSIKDIQEAALDKESISDFLAILKENPPCVMTVLLDSSGKGPFTHHKVVQAIAHALSISGQEPLILAYRNVWSSFEIEECDYFFPVTFKQEKEFLDKFEKYFPSQVSPAFPSSYLTGNSFPEIAMSIFKRNLSLLDESEGGRGVENNSNLSGVIGLKSMSTKEFIDFAASQLS
jgi:LmbE family N-acetylglucosaminyl deacetylase